MTAYPNIPNESARLDELESYSILDTLPDTDYDNLTAIASEICSTPISLISLIDTNRQWFKSHHGLEVSETPREYSFCAHAIEIPNQVFVVPDARRDKRFLDNPLVTGDPFIVFYAGVPLVTENGLPLGTLCIIDKKPRRLTESQKQSLEALANQVMKLLELRKSKHKLQRANQQLEEKNQMLEKFAQLAATDIKSPLNNIRTVYTTFLKKYQDKLDSQGVRFISSIKKSTLRLTNLVDGLLRNAKADRLKRQEKSTVHLSDVQEGILELYPPSDDYIIEFFFEELQPFHLNRVVLEEILINLVSNAVRYNDKVIAQVEVGAREDERYYEFFVSDNGSGIKESEHAKVFEMFTVLHPVDRFGEYGIGIGLANVKKLVDEFGGEITVDSEMSEGSIFTFSQAK
ncbi:MAG: ATP-binding protein [Cyclobacteriaceae bacterium]